MKKIKIASILLLLTVLTMPLVATTALAAAAPKAKNLTSITQSVNHAAPDSPIIFSHRGSPYNNPDHSFSGYNQAINSIYRTRCLVKQR